jgi:hypothetical protein
MVTEYVGRTAAIYTLFKRIGKKLFDALNTPQRSDAPKTAGMFAGSLVSQDHATTSKQHPTS